MTLFVGNLNYRANEHDIRVAFGPDYPLATVNIPLDHKSGLNRGIAFVNLQEDDREHDAIEEVGGKMLMGRSLRLEVSQKQTVV